MGGYRAERVAELIHQELAQRLRLEIKDDRIPPLSITHVGVNRDLSRATVDVMPLGGGEPTEETMSGLADAARQLRGPIGRALRLRHAPEIVFRADQHTENAIRVTHLLDQLNEERKGREES